MTELTFLGVNVNVELTEEKLPKGEQSNVDVSTATVSGLSSLQLSGHISSPLYNLLDKLRR